MISNTHRISLSVCSLAHFLIPLSFPRLSTSRPLLAHTHTRKDVHAPLGPNPEHVSISASRPRTNLSLGFRKTIYF